MCGIGLCLLTVGCLLCRIVLQVEWLLGRTTGIPGCWLPDMSSCG